MAKLISFVAVIVTTIVALSSPIHSQMQTGCSSAMLTSFTPCMTYVTNSMGSGASPSSDCCNSLKSLTSNGTDCMCLIATGSIPFKIPVNRTMAISLPKACKMAGVPLQCKAASMPVPARGPVAFGPTLSPTASAIPDPVASEPSSTTSALAPEADTTPAVMPPSTTSPTTANPGIRPVLTPSAATISYHFSPSLIFSVLVATILKSYN